MPCVVIGGGLTAIDTATEVMAFYPLQVEKILDRYEALCAAVRRGRRPRRCSTRRSRRCSTSSSRTGARCAPSGRGPRPRARRPTSCRSCERWGGVSLVYRKGMLDSPAYRLNHEEITKSLEEGIRFVERMNPEEAIPDEFGHVSAVRFREQINENGKWRDGDAVVTLPARSVFVAAGTTPERHVRARVPGHVPAGREAAVLQAARRRARAPTAPITLVPATEGLLHLVPAATARYVTYYGDNHPQYAGNVVKAMASARDGYPHVVAAVPRRRAAKRRRARPAARAADWRRVHRQPRRRLPRPRRARHPADADDRRGDREGAGRRAALPARPVLPPAELRDDWRPCSGPARTGRGC